jgi:hypothetical protein
VEAADGVERSFGSWIWAAGVLLTVENMPALLLLWRAGELPEAVS